MSRIHACFTKLIKIGGITKCGFKGETEKLTPSFPLYDKGHDIEFWRRKKRVQFIYYFRICNDCNVIGLNCLVD
jgi:hypothetical protein